MNPYIIDVVRRNRLQGNISLEKECIFIHIPKCGGNSIKYYFREMNKDSHVFAKTIPKEVFESFYSFTFVRNPISRCLSAYYFLLKGGTRNFSDLRDRSDFITKHKNFEDFVDNGLDEASMKQIHFIPQVRFVENRVFNFIGRFENFLEDFNELCFELNLPFEKMVVKNKSLHPAQSELPERTVRKIKEVYREDFNKFYANID